MTGKLSEGAMQAAIHKGLFKSGAARGFDWGSIDGEVIDAIFAEVWPLVGSEWIECSERLPTEEDGDIDGKVLWRIDRDGEIYHIVEAWNWPTLVTKPIASWMPFPPGREEK